MRQLPELYAGTFTGTAQTGFLHSESSCIARHLIPGDKTLKAIRSDDQRKRINDGGGLYLRLFVKGGSHSWRFDFSHGGKRLTISLGTYPDTGLALARDKAEKARELVGSRP